MTEQTLPSTEYPSIHIEQRPDPDDPTGFQLDVKASLDSTDHLVTILLLVVENITGVSPDLYAKEIDIVRRVARGGPLIDLDYDSEDEG